MRNRTLVGIVGALALALVATLAISQTVSANARFLTATWKTDPARHVCPDYLETRVTSTAGDCTLRARITATVGGALIHECEVTNDPTTPFDSVDDPLVSRVGLVAFASGTMFTIRADYLDAAGQLSFTQSQNFTKP